MTKVVQWYVAERPQEYSGIKIPLPNYFPWKSAKTTKPKRLRAIHERVLEDNIFKHFRDHTAPVLHPYHTWQTYQSQTEIKYIGRDSYNSKDFNIFPFFFRNQEDQVFLDPNKWPIDCLDKNTLDWLRERRDCTIVMFDGLEAKRLTGFDWATIPALTIQRKRHKIYNNFIWVNCQSNPEVLYEDKWHKIPDWLTIKGSHSWLEFPYDKLYLHQRGIELPNETEMLQPPNFNKGRFLFYAGRFRLARFWLLKELLKVIPRHQLYASCHGKELDKWDHKLLVKGMIGQHHNYDVKQGNNVINPWNDNDVEEFVDFMKTVPFDTFPKHLQAEAKGNYDSFKYKLHPNPDHYKEIFIDVSPETFNERNGLYHDTILFSEKIAKPIMAYRPFIVSANAGFYKELHKLGFKTFDHWWDEDFDRKSDIKSHTDHITSVIWKISKWSNEKCASVFEEMKPTLIHNRKTLEHIAYNAPKSWIYNITR